MIIYIYVFVTTYYICLPAYLLYDSMTSGCSILMLMNCRIAICTVKDFEYSKPPWLRVSFEKKTQMVDLIKIAHCDPGLVGMVGCCINQTQQLVNFHFVIATNPRTDIYFAWLALKSFSKA